MDERPPMRLYRDSEVNEIPPPEWLVEGILQTRKLAMLFGAEASLKSFITLGISYSVAHGVPWAGRGVGKGAVVYLYMEGGDSLQDRRAAWKLANDISVEEDADIFFLPEVLDLMDEGGEALLGLGKAIADRVGDHALRLIVVDTLSRAFGAKDPNTPKDMNLFVARCDSLKESFGATVLVVHHPGWDATREGNARNLRNSCDTVMKVQREGKSGLAVRLTFEKQKGATNPTPMELRLVEVEVGEARTSLAVPSEAKLEEITDEAALRSLEALAELRHATYTEWRKESENRGISETAFKRDLKDLTKSGWVPEKPAAVRKGHQYSLTTSGYHKLLESGASVTVPPQVRSAWSASWTSSNSSSSR